MAYFTALEDCIPTCLLGNKLGCGSDQDVVWHEISHDVERNPEFSQAHTMTNRLQWENQKSSNENSQ